MCLSWQQALKKTAPRLVTRRNYPYKGYADGLTTFLRTRYPDDRYRGIELEVNQKHALGDAAAWRALRRQLVASLRSAIAAITHA